jgi:hypothetical protein
MDKVLGKEALMNTLQKKEEEVSEHQEYLAGLVSMRETESEALQKLQEEKMEAASRNDGAAYQEIFKKLAQKSFKVDSLLAEEAKTREELAALEESLKSEKAEMESRLQEYLATRERERITALEESLPEELEKIASLYFDLCFMLGNIFLAVSRPLSDAGIKGSTIDSKPFQDAFRNMPFFIRDRYLTGDHVGCPGPWGGLLTVHPLLKGSSRDFLARLHDSISERQAQWKEEFFKNEEGA